MRKQKVVERVSPEFVKDVCCETCLRTNRVVAGTVCFLVGAILVTNVCFLITYARDFMALSTTHAHTIYLSAGMISLLQMSLLIIILALAAITIFLVIACYKGITGERK